MDMYRKEVKPVLFITLISLAVFSTGFLDFGRQKEKKQNIGERFHAATSLTWRSTLKDLVSKKPARPAQYKTYKEAKKIQLPDPGFRGMPLEEAIKKRRSLRNFSPEKMNMEQVSQLLFAAQGITGKMYGHHLRTAPSAGALYPFEIYVFIMNVEGIEQGMYHYAVREHALEMVKEGAFRSELTAAGLEQDMLGTADITFVLSAIFDRARHKYKERGFRYVYMEAGHISQNIALQAVSLDLGSVSVGAFIDDRINQLIGVDGRREAAIYLHAVGTV
jgi:SagB-type dehydrogenase family enzyme